jgi:aminopeptidase N
MPSLTHAEAVRRASSITVESYHIDLDLTRGDQQFRSSVTIRFRCAQPGIETFVELKAAALRAATLNGAPISASAFAGDRLRLTVPAEANTLTVEADMAYTNTGSGLHRFVDPADEGVYLYAGSFLDEASRIFACFDQPDLKAPVTLRVTADPSWVVAANGAERRIAPGRWECAETKPLATYFVTLIAGPYHVVRAEHDGVPMALYARASLGPHLEAQASHLFEVTRNCLDRYHELFRVRYPFGKYDQAFVPESGNGAMENPGCVTFDDNFIFTSAATQAQVEERACVIAHEMAHMWFGDLVTMRWWDDLWLNESFAEYLGYRVTAEATSFTEAWTGFAVGRKAWGYAADQRPSTHPVSGQVRDAAQAFVNFDGISYAKGASVLKQLAAILGDDEFLAGLRSHFEKHAYGNASLADLLETLSEASGRDLSAWAVDWLRTPQVNTLTPIIWRHSDDDRFDVEVRQTAPPLYPTLRSHRFDVAVYGRDGKSLDRARVELSGDRVFVNRLRAGGVVVVNDGDLTYAKTRLDPDSLRAAATMLPACDDSLTRALIWGAVWDTTRDAELDARVFVDLCATALPYEEHVAVFDDVLRYARDYAATRYLRPEEQVVGLAALRTVCRTALDRARPGASGQLAAARGLVSCSGPDDVEWMNGWLNGPSQAPEALRIDSEMRWLLIRQLAALGAIDEADIDGEFDRDRSASGAEHAAAARAARPDAVAKGRAWAALLEGTSLSNRLLAATARGFWRPGQECVTAAYVSRLATDLPAMAQSWNPQIAEHLTALLIPAYAVDEESLAMLREISDDGSLPAGMRRAVVDGADELARSLAARALASSARTHVGG